MNKYVKINLAFYKFKFMDKLNFEEILIKEKKEQEIIFDSIPAWIFYKDKENRFIKVNKAFAEAMGKRKVELEGKSLFDIYPKEEAEKYAKDDEEVISSGKAKMNITEEIKTPNKTLWVQTNKIPYRNELGNIIGIIGFTIDITDLKCAEDKLKSHTEEMEKLNQFMVNRELKMVELKEEIERLKKQIK